MTPALRLEGVTKRFGDVVAVDDVTLDLFEGEFLALLGASGCGKSTTLRLFAGLDAATQGRILLRGRDVSRESASSRNVALMFQSYALYPHMSVYQNIAMPLRMRGLSVPQRFPGARMVSRPTRTALREIDDKVRQVAAMLRLDTLLSRRPGQLSGGQQQRVALARALVREPSAFFLDEPLSNLDTQLKADTRDEIRALHARTGYPFLLVTHDQADALSMADRVAVMIAGRIAQIGVPEEVFQRPQSRAVAEFIGLHRMNILDRGHASRLHQAGATLDLGVRPEDLIIGTEGPIAAKVESLLYKGEETVVLLRDPDGFALRSILRGGQPRPAPGDHVRLSAAVSALHPFDQHGNRAELQP